ncbi:MAG TPA: RNase adapter RapZ, partial [Acetobacteraceae bacterium]|nr:RNase adapter RapZ [Acetobacteraceae bacterium]
MVKRVVVVSGLSGAGKASILRALEDIGYNAVDNPPLTLLETLISRDDQPLAVGLDTRSRGFDGELVRRAVARLKATPGVRAELVYAWADEAALLRRYTETRRRHPMAPQGRVIDGIRMEQHVTRPLRDEADLVIDT